MNEKDQKITLPVISDDLLKALDGLFPERTPDINMEPKEMCY